ncbi:MAG: hemin uptake protein HemP [Pseudomonadota bacterium]
MNMPILRFDEIDESAPQRAPRYDALDLVKSGNLAEIALGEQIYTLRITRAGKLLLTK